MSGPHRLTVRGIVLGLALTGTLGHATRSDARIPGIQTRTFAAHGLPGPITVGPDGNLWYTAYGGEIHRLTLRGADRVFRARTRDRTSSGAIAPGADGALWFTVPGGEQVGRVSTRGRVRLFRVPRVDGVPATDVGGIVQGFDGDMWFTTERCCGHHLAGTIGRITPQGRITQYPVRDEQITPTAIARGPQRQLWFGSSAYYVGSVTMHGRIVAHHLRAPFAGSLLAQGRDGALWSLQPGGVSELTSDRAVRQYSYPGHQARKPLAIAPGYTGRVWFATNDPDYDVDTQIGVVTSGGQVLTTPVGNGGGEGAGLTSAPDGNIWMTQFEARAVTRVSSSGSAASHETGRIELAQATVSGRGVHATLLCAGPSGEYCQGRVTRVAAAGAPRHVTLGFTIATGTRLWVGFKRRPGVRRTCRSRERISVDATLRDPAGRGHRQRAATVARCT